MGAQKLSQNAKQGRVRPTPPNPVAGTQPSYAVTFFATTDREGLSMRIGERTGAIVLALAAVAAFGLAWHLAVAQTADTEAAHVAAADQAAGQDLRAPFRLCPGAPQPPAPTSNTAESAKIFDNLYFVGIPAVSAWAITTSNGIIVIDSLNNAREAETFIEGGLRKVGLDPAQVKYVLITHGHTDHFGGAQYLADKLHAQLVMSETDWNFLATQQPSTNPNRGPIPKRGMSVRDGEKLMVGDTSIEIYETPPHTPGTVSLIIPLRDGNVRHVGALWGGNSFNFQPTEANFTTYANSVAKFAQIAKERGADVQMSNHPNFDEALEKIAKLKTRAPGQSHPFVVGAEAEARIFTVQSECALASRARLRSAAAK
jgi:metallo-beta-lactamase class B